MKRALLVVLGLGLAAVLLGGGVVLALFLAGVFRPRPDINQVGGTVLVYELEEEQNSEDFKPEELAAAVQRRVDPSGAYGITAGPVGERRVEVQIPGAGGEHAARVEWVKELLASVGNLEFRILANDRNDKEAQDAARKFFESARSNDKVRQELATLAAAGKPPPPPRATDGTRVFDTPLGKFTYSWVEVGRAQRYVLGLDDPAEKDLRQAPGRLMKFPEGAQPTEPEEKILERAKQAREAFEARARGEAMSLFGGLLLFSRAAPGRRPDGSMKYDYFLLSRDPEPGKEITGAHLIKVQADTDSQGRPAVRFGLDDTGANLFRELTSANLPSPDGATWTQLAILLDGQVVSAPAIRGTVGGEGQIAGNFTKEEVDRMVTVLRSGALPARLKPLPVSETELPPNGDRSPAAGGKP
jgi:preprotein translocase subunit SecD